jgi:hypothetical protein
MIHLEPLSGSWGTEAKAPLYYIIHINMNKEKMSFEVKTLKKLDNPVPGTGNVYIALVDIRCLPKELKNWRKINVRDPKMTQKVARDIMDSLSGNPLDFHLKNRGLTIIANKLDFDNKVNILNIYMKDVDKHGILDGGHTFNVILEFLKTLSKEELEKFEGYVRLEIIESIRDKDLGIDIVEARNNSLQVQDESLAELRNEFSLIKQVLKNQSYANDIAYKQFEWDDEGNPKEIPIIDILSTLMCFDIDIFNEDRHPTDSGMSKKRAVNHFIRNKNGILKIIKLLPDFLKLKDLIYHDLPIAYNEDGGRFRRLKCVGAKNIHLKFIDTETDTFVPKGFVYPILAAFRSLLVCKGRRAKWSRDPFVFWKLIQKKASSSLVQRARELERPSNISKERPVWENLYRMFELEKERM